MTESGHPKRHDDTGDLYASARKLINELGPVVRSLSEKADPILVELIRSQLTNIWAEDDERSVNKTSVPTSLEPRNIGLLERNATYPKSQLSASDIDLRQLQNRNIKSKLRNDVILLLLEANEEADVTFDDIQHELKSLGIAEAPNSLSGRLHRLRKDKFLLPKIASGSGVYKLSEIGKAEAAKVKVRRMKRR